MPHAVAVIDTRLATSGMLTSRSCAITSRKGARVVPLEEAANEPRQAAPIRAHGSEEGSAREAVGIVMAPERRDRTGGLSAAQCRGPCYDRSMKYIALIAALLLAVSSASAQQRTRLLVYSTLEPENIADFKKAFEAEDPDVEIVWARDSTGVVTAKILAEQGAIS